MIRFDWDQNVPRDLRRLSRNLDKARGKLNDRTDPLQKIKKRQAQQWKVNFDRQGAIYGPWAPLAASTVRKRGGKRTPLVDTGALIAHFTSLNEAGEVTNDAVNWNMFSGGAAGARGIFAQHFGFGPKGGFRSVVPSRVLWDFNDDDREAAEDILYTWADRILERYFGV